ncbi:M56 family metallopeptidase [Cellulophaga sp. HaHa_2_1]|uniref:M56 family metallopeptidase n=1 Tax=Cellulophaga sp. HaHa_2_1 TaxID=2749994 RepID=UPI001C4FD0B6|nr:M56 family metallopeptidase [Cellulophaga sp. HaHa_2_1]QXP51499.1 M56 family metallopeptidase [Cellulophaga sp. HaHa_2_1]
MIQYILESIAFQLLFLIVYDLFLKKETFFQWNRVYLIGTYVLSLVLPWIKIEALKTKVSETTFSYPEFLWNRNDLEVSGVSGTNDLVSWFTIVLIAGMVLAGFIFVFKLYQLKKLKDKGTIQHLNDFTQIVIRNSEIAFSFFKSVFLGDKVLDKDYESIVAHELVHIRQGHSYDLVFFELLRIINWFNPLVYVYQNRISELHEFIADAQVSKTHKTEQYQLLLSQVFQTENISFINPFFKSSLIKKRIVMLQKSKSKRVFQLKYVVLVPLILGMLFYSSCENELKTNELEQGATLKTSSNEQQILEVSDYEKFILEVSDLDNLTEKESIQKAEFFSKVEAYKEEGNFVISDGKGNSIKIKTNTEGIESVNVIKGDSAISKEEIDYDNATDVPFMVVNEAPVFPGCEDVENQRACFKEKLFQHINKNFKYPQEAQDKGIQGKVNLMFIIDETGNIAGLRMRGPDKILEEEAERIISLLPKMTPGKQNGKVVRVPFSIPISFKLQ